MKFSLKSLLYSVLAFSITVIVLQRPIRIFVDSNMIADLCNFPRGLIASCYWIFWLCYHENWIGDMNSTFEGLGVIIGIWIQAAIIVYIFIRILHRICFGKWAW